MKRIFAFILILFISVSFLMAENKGRLFFHHLDKRDGLSNVSVSSIVQDYRGFIWFATLNGLNRYDGRSIKLYSHDPYDRNSLVHNKIQTMNKSGKYLLIGTYGGLSLFDPDSGVFKNFTKTPGDINSLTDNVVVYVIPDDKGNLWVGTLNGLNYLDPRTGKNRRFFNVKDDPDSLANNVIRSLHIDSSGDLWVGTYNGLDRYSREEDKFFHYGMEGREGYSLPSKYVMTIAKGDKDNLWLGTWDGGVSSFNIATGKIKTYSLEDNRVYTLHIAPSGQVWA
ncbi:MAG: hybrid sensor histidine kinase/response regulator, partial [Spirochaetes bacterium]